MCCFVMHPKANSMIEVFKTNVGEADKASQVIKLICTSFRGYQANFDLDDCDNILRVVSNNGQVYAHGIIQLLQRLGLHAEVLP